MSAAALLGLITALIASAPELISDVEKIVADLKNKPPPPGGEAAAAHAAMDALLVTLLAAKQV